MSLACSYEIFSGNWSLSFLNDVVDGFDRKKGPRQLFFSVELFYHFLNFLNLFKPLIGTMIACNDEDQIVLYRVGHGKKVIYVRQKKFSKFSIKNPFKRWIFWREKKG